MSSKVFLQAWTPCLMEQCPHHLGSNWVAGFLRCLWQCIVIRGWWLQRDDFGWRLCWVKTVENRKWEYSERWSGEKLAKNSLAMSSSFDWFRTICGLGAAPEGDVRGSGVLSAWGAMEKNTLKLFQGKRVCCSIVDFCNVESSMVELEVCFDKEEYKFKS